VNKSLDLDSINFLNRDKEAKSLSYNYSVSPHKLLTLDMLDAMILTASKKRQNVRINFHSDSNELHHDMIILQWRGTYVRPHKHQNKSESCFVIKGEHHFIVFDEMGNSIDKVMMGPVKARFYKVNAGYYHMSIPVSDYVIFYESKNGPFVKKDDSIFPDWSPPEDSIEQDKYISKLIS